MQGKKLIPAIKVWLDQDVFLHLGRIFPVGFEKITLNFCQEAILSTIVFVVAWFSRRRRRRRRSSPEMRMSLSMKTFIVLSSLNGNQPNVKNFFFPRKNRLNDFFLFSTIKFGFDVDVITELAEQILFKPLLSFFFHFCFSLSLQFWFTFYYPT